MSKFLFTTINVVVGLSILFFSIFVKTVTGMMGGASGLYESLEFVFGVILITLLLYAPFFFLEALIIKKRLKHRVEKGEITCEPAYQRWNKIFKFVSIFLLLPVGFMIVSFLFSIIMVLK